MLDDGFDFSVGLCPDISVDGNRGSFPRAVAEEVVEELFRKDTTKEKRGSVSTKIVDDRETRVEAFGEYRHVGDEDSSDGKVVF